MHFNQALQTLHHTGNDYKFVLAQYKHKVSIFSLNLLLSPTRTNQWISALLTFLTSTLTNR